MQNRHYPFNLPQAPSASGLPPFAACGDGPFKYK